MTQNITAIEEAGRRWTRGNHDRIYITEAIIAELFDGDTTRQYIYAAIDGQAARINRVHCKIFFDLNTGAWVVQGTEWADEIAAALTDHFAEEEAEDEVIEDATDEQSSFEQAQQDFINLYGGDAMMILMHIGTLGEFVARPKSDRYQREILATHRAQLSDYGTDRGSEVERIDACYAEWLDVRELAKIATTPASELADAELAFFEARLHRHFTRIDRTDLIPETA